MQTKQPARLSALLKLSAKHTISSCTRTRSERVFLTASRYRQTADIRELPKYIITVRLLRKEQKAKNFPMTKNVKTDVFHMTVFLLKILMLKLKSLRFWRINTAIVENVISFALILFAVLLILSLGFSSQGGIFCKGKVTSLPKLH